MTQQFIGTKIILAVTMNRRAYNDYRGWALPDDENGDDAGYLVEYTDGGTPNHPDHAGYISWSPNAQFDNAYRPTSGMSFGLAIEALKLGKSVFRSGWNGANQFVYKLDGSKIASAAGYGFGEYLGEPTFGNLLVLRTTQNKLNAWVPSTGDLFADDWQLVE